MQTLTLDRFGTGNKVYIWEQVSNQLAGDLVGPIIKNRLLHARPLEYAAGRHTLPVCHVFEMTLELGEPTGLETRAGFTGGHALVDHLIRVEKNGVPIDVIRADEL